MSHWLLRAALFALSATSAGALIGILLGLSGGAITPAFRLAMASILAVFAAGLGAIEVTGHRSLLIQHDVETPQDWTTGNSLRWPVLNGFALGVGVATRVGFWLWYVVPVSAFLIGQPLIAAVLYGTYALMRTTAPTVLLVAWNRWRWTQGIGNWLLNHEVVARRIAAFQLVVVGAVAAIIIGV